MIWFGMFSVTIRSSNVGDFTIIVTPIILGITYIFQIVIIIIHACWGRKNMNNEKRTVSCYLILYNIISSLGKIFIFSMLVKLYVDFFKGDSVFPEGRFENNINNSIQNEAYIKTLIVYGIVFISVGIDIISLLFIIPTFLNYFKSNPKYEKL